MQIGIVSKTGEAGFFVAVVGCLGGHTYCDDLGGEIVEKHITLQVHNRPKKARETRSHPYIISASPRGCEILFAGLQGTERPFRIGTCIPMYPPQITRWLGGPS